MADLIAQADALIKGRLRADRLPECSFDDGKTWQTDDVIVAETFALSADLIEALTAQVAVMGEAGVAVKKAVDPIAVAVNRAVNNGPNGKVVLTQMEAMALVSAVNRLAAAKEPS